MGQATRQSELFAGEDWTVIYRAFTEINFNSFDFDTIRSSLVDYIRFNYPEDFNDWIESSEFVAMIDLLAYLGQTLAFRMDINTRDNFIDTAERRESLLRLARLLSYPVSRNIPARGIVKITKITTDEPIIDSMNQQLQNLEITWDDANNPDWFEQFILILNSVFETETPFGQPLKTEIIDGVPTQLFRGRTEANSSGQYPFTATVDGDAFSFEVVNVNFEEGTTFFEREPNPLFAMHFIYRNDGNGNSSPNTGFFFYFKQGTMNFQDFQIDIPIENRVIDIDTVNINQFDVFFQSIDDDGNTLKVWKKVPGIVGNNIIFNSLNKDERDIFSVITRDDDAISLRFADGVFGNVPTGTVRAYYRTSINAQFTILPKDMQDVTIAIPYFNKDGNSYTLLATFDLQAAVANNVPTETIDQIRLRAPQVYYTQNRMVNGEDYNVFPLQSTEILKMKAINRVYSGHSRFIDINDPTATFQDTNVIADDGAVFRQLNRQLVEVLLAANLSSGEMVSLILFGLLKNIELTQFFYLNYRDVVPDPVEPGSPFILWERSSNAAFSTTGQFISGSSQLTDVDITTNLGGLPLGFVKLVGVDNPANDPADFITPGTLVEFQFAGWQTVASVTDNGSGFFASGKGKVTISEEVETNDRIISIFPTFRTELTSEETTSVRGEIDSKNTFGMKFDHTTQKWEIIVAANLAPADQNFSLDFFNDLSLQNKNSAWLVRFDFRTDRWEILSQGLRYIWESEKDVRFFVNQFFRVVSNINGRASRDKIKIFSTEAKPAPTLISTTPSPGDTDATAIATTLAGEVTEIKVLTPGDNYLQPPQVTIRGLGEGAQAVAILTEGKVVDIEIIDGGSGYPSAQVEIFRTKLIEEALGEDILFAIIDTFIYEDGYQEPRRVVVGFNDVDLDGIPDDPMIFEKIVTKDVADDDLFKQHVFHSTIIDQFGYKFFVLDNTIVPISDFNMPGMEQVDINNVITGSTVWNATNKNFYLYTGENTNPARITENNYVLLDQSIYEWDIGRSDLNFLWNHVATKDQRIDPAITNIIDIFVLTSNYDIEYRRWIADVTDTVVQPEPPTTENLRITFSEFEEFKMVSDQIIWKPVKYKPLFGNKAPEELTAKFKVVKVPGTEVSDGEIKTQIIQNINIFFEITRWDFGDTFFASELQAFIHLQMPTIIGGIELVPENEEAKFGNLQQIRSETDEIFISTATVIDVDIVKAFTESVLRVDD